MKPRFLTALPVYNEARSVSAVLDEVRRHSRHVLVVDDGSTDGTAELLAARRDIARIRHRQNQGYGAALKTAFDYAARHDFDVLVTIDCDGQHEPQRIERFVEACAGSGGGERGHVPRIDIVSGSRYLQQFEGDSEPPGDRRRINHCITAELNSRLGLALTDAFCGFKAYRVSSLKRLALSEPGYAMPIELWTQAAHLRLNIVELPVPLIYLDEKRSFGGALDDADTRLQYYRLVLERSLAAVESGSARLGRATLCGKGNC
jgi:dolichol-phosphate mannosyltransferase